MLSGRTRQESTGSYARARTREKWHRFRIMQLKWGESREEQRGAATDAEDECLRVPLLVVTHIGTEVWQSIAVSCVTTPS
eukprot:COSAG06_NODE_4050_length_4631_cov_2.710062_7_plen_80_part_00